MKKLLLALFSSSIVSTSAATVIACGDSEDTIGIVLSTTANPYFAEMRRIAEEYLDEKDYTPVFYDSNDNTTTELTNIETAITRGHSGIIVNPNNAEAISNAAPIIDAKIPLVTVDREFINKAGAASFVTNNVLESKKLFDNIAAHLELPDNEQMNVYVLRGVSGADASNRRYEGFIQNNIDRINLIGTSANNFANWERSTALTNVETNINVVRTANIIFAENDEMAMGALQALDTTENRSWFDNGYIIGFDGNDDTKASIEAWSETTRNNVFSTIEQDPSTMIKEAIDEIIAIIESDEEIPTSYITATAIEGILISAREGSLT